MTNERYMEIAELIPPLGATTRGLWTTALRVAGVSNQEIDDWFAERERRGD